MTRKELQKFIDSTVVVTSGKADLPKPITAEDIKRNPRLKPVAIAGANTYAIQLHHLIAMRRRVQAVRMRPKDRKELIGGLEGKFNAVKAEAHYLFPDSVMFQEPGESKPTPY